MAGSDLLSSLARRGLFGLTLQLVLRLRGLLLIPILVRVLVPAEVGVLNLGNAFAGWLTPLLMLGLNTGLALRVVHLKGTAVRPAVLTVLSFSAALSILGTALVVIATQQRFLGAVFVPLIPVLLPLALLVIGTTTREVALVFPQVRQDLRFIAQNSILTDFGGTALAIILVLMGFGASGALLGPAVTSLLGAAIAVSYSLRRSEGSWTWDRPFLAKALRAAVPVLPLALAFWTLQSSDYFFVSYFHGTAELAIYALAYNLASPALMGIAAINLVYLPTCVEILGRGRSEFARFLDTSTRLLALAGISGVVFSVVSGPSVTAWFAGEAYTESGYLLPVVVGAYVLFSMAQLQQFVPGVMTQDLSGAARAHSQAAAFNVVASLVVIPRYGSWGAAWVTFASYGLALFLMLRVGRALLPEIAWPQSLGRLSLLAVVSTGVALLGRPAVGSPIVALSLGLLCVVVVALLAAALGLLTRDDLRRLKLSR